MAKYVDVEAIKAELLKEYPNGLYPEDIGEAVECASAADVAPVVHAHWFFTEYEFFTCSACGGAYYSGAESTAQAESYLNSGFTHRFCPNCGAKMDGGQHETD